MMSCTSPPYICFSMARVIRMKEHAASIQCINVAIDVMECLPGILNSMRDLYEAITQGNLSSLPFRFYKKDTQLPFDRWQMA